MRERFQLPLPMWRVQYQLLGGGRRMLAVVMVCTALLIFGTIAILRLLSKDPFPTVVGWILNFIAGIQVLVVVLGGCNAVYRAMLRDYETKMIESHRLTPMSNIAVPLGYLFGSTLQVTTLFVLFTVFGAILSFLAGLPATDWVLGNLVLLIGGIALWAAVVFSGMRLEKPFNPAPLILVIASLSVLISFVPGMALLFNVYTVYSAVQIITSTGNFAAPAAVIPAVVSLVFAVFWLSVSAVKYRRPDLPALNALRGLLLLAVVLLLGTAGIVAFDEITRTSMRSFYDSDLRRTQWIATMIGALILASVAVGGAVKCRMLVARGAAARDWSDRVSDLLVAVVAALMICLVMAAIGTPIWPDLLPKSSDGLERTGLIVRVWAYSTAACLVALVSLRSLFELAGVRLKSANTIVGLFVLAVWAMPPMADFIRAEYLREGGERAELSALLGCSPAGTVIAVWAPLDVSLFPGMVLQIALAVALAYLVSRARAVPPRPALP